MIRTAVRMGLAAVLAVAVAPARADQAPITTLATGEFSANSSAGTTMTCAGYPTRTCTHSWNATTCFEAAADTDVGSNQCDVRTVGTTNRTSGTAHWTPNTGYLCTTTNIGTELTVIVFVDSATFPDGEVSLDVVQTNGVGTFEGSTTSASRTLIVTGTFATPGSKGGPCAPLSNPGSFQGTYEITTPV